MKRLITTVLMMTYMAAAIGFTFSFHYCGGEYHGICFTGDTEKDCCGEMEEGNEGCCEDKVVSAKYKDDHTPSAFKVVLTKATLAFIPVAHFTDIQEPLYKGASYEYHYNKGPAPPLIKGVPLYLFFRVLRL